MGLYKLVDATLRAAWWRVMRLWRPMALWTLLSWVLMGLVLVPLSSGVLHRIFFRGERALLGNEELLGWMLTPEGIAGVTGAGLLITLAAVVRFAGFYWMVTDDMAGESVSVHRTFRDLLPDLPALYRLCAVVTVGVLLLLAVLAAGLYLVYVGWLDQYDINYYIAVKPPEWGRALLAAGAWAAVWIAGAGYVVIRSLPAVPAYLGGHRPVRAALRRSWQMASGKALRTLRAAIVIAVTWLALRVLVQSILFRAASHLATTIAANTTSVTPLIAVSATYSASILLFDAVLSFLGFSILATVLIKQFHEDDATHASAHTTRAGIRPGSLATLRRWLRPSRAVPVLLAAVFLSTALSGYIITLPVDQPSVVVTAHRAGAHLATENTLAALERSIEVGADYAEIDVQSTRDSVIVVVHDADLMRLALDPRIIAGTDYAELSDVVLGRDPDVPASERRVATLDEFLDRAKGRIGLNIELKYYGPNPSLAPRVLEIVRRHEMTAPEDVVIMSLDLEAVRQVRRLAPEIHTGYVATLTMGSLDRLSVDFLAVPRQMATERFVRRTQRRNVDVHVWTLNSTDAVVEMIERDVDGIITDDPRLVRRLIDEITALSVPERLLLSFQPLLLED
ncbi:MAG: glycerophosphodiester phosphodiesterase family protein [Rhodothermales bacterium]